MAKPTRIVTNVRPRAASTRGPSSSADWNDLFQAAATDLSNITNQWNRLVVPLSGSIPDGLTDPAVDAFKFGLDGRHLYVDSTADGIVAANIAYWNTVKSRPNTVYEQFIDIYRAIDETLIESQSSLAAISSGLTLEQKQKIGINIFDSSQSSSSTSIDGRSKNNQLNITQLAADLYGPTGTVDNDGSANLANSVKAMVDALLELHNGNWDNDITLSHDGAITNILQANVLNSSVYNDSYAGSPTSTQDDLNQVRTRIKAIAGTAAWLTAIVEGRAGGPTGLQGVINETGSGTKTASNPWGYSYTNIDGLETRINATNTYTGQTSQIDSSPDYTSNNYLQDGWRLVEGISRVDSGIATTMTAHKKGTWPVVPPAGEHYDGSIYLDWWNESKSLRDFQEYAIKPSTTITYSGMQFRRLETWIPPNTTVLTVNHNRASYPINQTIFFPPSSGVLYSIEHTTNNQFVFSGVSYVQSGVIISLW